MTTAKPPRGRKLEGRNAFDERYSKALSKGYRRPDPDRPVNPAHELIEDDGLTWEQRVEAEATGRVVRRIKGKE